MRMRQRPAMLASEVRVRESRSLLFQIGIGIRVSHVGWLFGTHLAHTPKLTIRTQHSQCAGKPSHGRSMIHHLREPSQPCRSSADAECHACMTQSNRRPADQGTGLCRAPALCERGHTHRASHLEGTRTQTELMKQASSPAPWSCKEHVRSGDRQFGMDFFWRGGTRAHARRGP